MFLWAMLIAAGFSWLVRKPLKKYPGILYGAGAVLSLVLGIFPFSQAPVWLSKYGIELFQRGLLATALWVIVMVTGALPNNAALRRLWLPIRGELSILAAIFTVSHNIAYGKIYFAALLRNPAELSGLHFAAALVSVCMLAIMLPLTVLSFPEVRRKMRPKKWKQIQKLAYGFYGLLYLHILLVLLPGAQKGNLEVQFELLLYSLVFFTYGVCRVLKSRKSTGKGQYFWGAALLAAAMVGVCVLMFPGDQIPPVPTEENSTYRDGTYSASAVNDFETVTVTVTISGNVITELSAVSSEENSSFFQSARDSVVPAILKTQKPEADAVSGATYSSQSILEAVDLALQQAAE